MASVEQIKKVILDVAGNPGVGIIAELADKWAVSIAALDDKTLQQVNAKDGKGDAAVKDGTKFLSVAKLAISPLRIFPPFCRRGSAFL